MKILSCHNRYQQLGGEDATAETEFLVLKEFGEDVEKYERNNSEFFDCLLLR